MTSFNHYCILCILALAVSHCQSSDDVSYDSGKKSANSGDVATQPSPTGATGSNVIGGGVISSTPVAGVDILTTDNSAYPTVEFCGTGNIKSISDRNPIQVATKQEISVDKVDSHTTRFTSSDRTINKEVVKLTGKTTFTRSSKTDLVNRQKEDGFKNEIFLMFANKSESATGAGQTSLRFSSPFPFLVIPTEMRRYDSLSAGSIDFNNIIVRDQSGKRLFTVNTSVSQLDRSGSTIRVQVSNIIPEDTNGSLYDKLPLPRNSIYEINTETKKVMRLSTSTIYYNSHKKAARDMTIDLALKSYSVRGKTEQHASCP